MTYNRLAATRTRRGAFLIMVLAALALAFLAAPQFAHAQNQAVTVQWTATTKTIAASWSDPGACEAPSRYVIYYAFSGTNVKLGDVAATATSFSKSVLTAATDFSIKVYCGNATAAPNGRLVGEAPVKLATSGAYKSHSVTEVASDWSLVPSGLNVGDEFRLLIITSTTRNGQSSTIGDYDTHVQGAVAGTSGHTDIQSHSSLFQVVGCTEAVDARVHTGTTGTGVPIYWLNGNKAADNYADFYDGSWDEEATGKDESGTDVSFPASFGDRPFTGCGHDGTESTSHALGNSQVTLGRPNTAGLQGPLSSGSSLVRTSQSPFYGLSSVFRVVAAVTSTDATLSALTVSEGTLHGFPDSRPFVVGVANSVTSIDVTPTVNDSGATITVNTNAVTSESAHTVSSLAVGRNTVTVVVTAEDATTTETYTIHVERGVATDYGWKAADDLNGLYAAGNTTASGLWSNETTMWVADIQDDNLYAYARSDGTRQTVLDIDPAAGNDNPQGIWSDGNTVWVADWDDRKLYAYALSGGARQANLEFNLHSDNLAPGGIWSNGPTMWVVDVIDRKLYAYALSSGARQTSLDFNLHADNGAPRDIWSDGVTLWVSDSGTDKKLYVYKLTPGADFGTRDSGRDFNTMDAAGNHDPYGIWSDGITMWVANDGSDELDKVFSYNMPPPGLGIADASADEGEAITFTVTLGLGASGTVTVQYATSGGTATEDTDYTAASGTLTFNAGETTKTITVQTTDDTTAENAETFTVTLSNPTGDAAISDATATGTITEPASTDATLSALTVSEGTLHGFPDSRPFVVGVANSVTSIDVTPTVSDDGATITVNGDAASSGNAHTVSSLAVGRNTVTVLVTAADTTTTETYTIHVERGVTTDYGWKAADDLNGLYAAGNGFPYGIWSDGTDIWVSDRDDTYVYAYDSDGTRRTGLEFDLHAFNVFPGGIWSDGTTMWVGSDTPSVFAYALSDGTLQDGTGGTTDLGFDLGTGQGNPAGMWSDGTTLWVADFGDDKLYAYALSGGARQDGTGGTENLDFDLHADNGSPRGVWSDGVTLWVSDINDNKLYAYKFTAGSDFGTRDSARDFNTLDAAGNDSPWGIWSDGATMWVAEDDEPKVFSYNMPPPGLGIADASADEGEAITFTVTLGLGASGTVTVQYATSGGTATEGTDYTVASGTLTFNPGETTKTFTVQTTGDTDAESDETFTVTLSNPTGDAAISDATATGTIDDDDEAALPTVGITADRSSIRESLPDPVIFTVTRSASSAAELAVTVDVSETGADIVPAGLEGERTVTIAANQASQTFTLLVPDNDVWNLDSVVTASIVAKSHYQISGTEDSVAVNVEDDDFSDATVTLEATGSTDIDEGTSGSYKIVVTTDRDEEPHGCAGGITVEPSGGTAMGTDYNALNNFGSPVSTRPCGISFSRVDIDDTAAVDFRWRRSSATFQLRATDDTLDEDDETVILTAMATDAAYTVHMTEGSLTYTIKDNDDPPNLSINDASGNEGGAIDFTVNLSAASGKTVMVAYATSGDTATEDTDYTAASGMVTFAVGETAKTITVQTVQDTDVEGDETFTVTLSGPTNAAISDDTATGTIEDDDAVASVALAADNDAPAGVWVDGGTIWVADTADTYVYAYDLATGNRNTTLQFNLHAANADPYGVASPDGGTTVLVVDRADRRVRDYRASDGVHLSVQAFNLVTDNAHAAGLWTDGVTAWVVDTDDTYVYAYTLGSGAQDSGAEFDLDAANTAPWGVWSDGVTAWVTDSGADKLFAYTLADGSRAATLDISLSADNGDPAGLGGVGGQFVWVVDTADDTRYRYGLPALVSLEVDHSELAEAGGVATVTASVSAAQSAALTVTVSAAAVSPATSADFTLSANQTLTIAAGATESAGTVTLTAVDNDAASNDKTIKLSAAVTGVADLRDAADLRLRIIDDESAPLATENDAPAGLWVDGGTAWVADTADTFVYAYDLATGNRNTAVQFDTHSVNQDVYGVASDDSGATVFVTDRADRRVYHYQSSTGNHIGTRAFNLVADNAHAAGIWTDGTTVLVVDTDDTYVYAYTLGSGARDTGAEFDLDAANAAPWGVWSDGSAVWVADSTADKLFAYTLADGTRLPGADVSLVADNADPVGLAGHDGVLWVADGGADRLFSYKQPTTLSIADATGDEGEAITFTVTLGLGASGTVNVDYATSGGTATEDTDYTAASGSLTFNAGEKTKTITVQTTSDSVADDGETFTVTLSNLTGDAVISDATATGTISDANKAPTFTSSAAFSAAENQTAVGTVTAFDVDSEDAVTGYSLTGGADMAKFMITPKGALTFVTAPDHDSPTDVESTNPVNPPGNNEYIVEVTVASGTGDRATTAVQTITVTVTAPVELVSNDGQPTSGSIRPPVGANEVAQGFTTGANSSGYTLSNIQVRTWSGPTGSETLTVTLNDDNSGEPGDVVATLENPATVENGLMTYTAPVNTKLAARTTYYVVFSYSADTGGPALNSPTTNHEDSGRVPPWSIDDDRHERDRDPVGAWTTDPSGLEIKVNGGLAPDTTAPVLRKRELIDTTTLTLTYNEPLKDSAPPASAYTVYVGAAETQQTPTNVAVSGGTVTLTLGTAVTAGETVTLSYTAPTGAGAAPVEDEAGNDAADFTKQTVLNPASRPTISNVAVTSTAPAWGTYALGDVIEVTVTFSETVTVDTTLGTPYLKLQMTNRSRVHGEFDRGSGTTALVFAFTVGAGHHSGLGANGELLGFLINANELELGGGSIESTANSGVSATLTYTEVPRSSDHRVGARIRDILVKQPAANGVFHLGEAIDVTVVFTQHIYHANRGVSKFKVDVGGTERLASFVEHYNVGGRVGWRYRYTVVEGEEDADGISLPANAFQRNSATMTVLASDTSRIPVLDSNAVGPFADRRVDGVIPVLETAVVVGSTLSLTYSEALDDTSTPPTTAYSLAVTSGTAPTVSSVAVSGRAVRLTLSRAVISTETLTLDYTAPTGVGATPVQDVARNDAADLDNQSVTPSTDTTAPQPTITLVASTTGAEDFKLLISFGEAVTGFTKSDIVLNDAWLIEAAATLEGDSTTPGKYSVPIVPSPNVAGLTVPLNVTIAAAAAQDTANDSLAGTLALEKVYTGPATYILQVDPTDADGAFDIEVYFLDGQISGRPVTGFEASDIMVHKGSVKMGSFRKVPPRYQKDDGAHQGGDDFQGAFTGHILFEATITPDAGCDTLPCTVTVDVARGAATSADITQDYWVHTHSGWTTGDPVDEGHTPRPNFKANTLTVQRESMGTNLYVRALALYRDPNNFAYRASFLMNEENQTLRKTHFDADNATLKLIGADEPRLLWEFWAEVAADGNVTLKADLNVDGDYDDGMDYTYTITGAKKTLPAPKTVRAARSADGGNTAKSRTAEAAQAVEIPDAALRSILEALLGKQAGDALTTADLATVVSLNLRDSGVAALGGLQHAVNLTDLYLEDFSLNLAPLQGLGLFVHVPGAEPLRLPSTDATLSGLTLSGVNIGAFDPATSDYTAGVGNDVTETTVTATANDGGAAYVIKLGGVEDADGVIPLAVGANVISIEVTAEDGQTTKTYTVTATRAEASPSSDATLSSLELSGITFDFDPATYSYDLSVGNEVTETAVTVETNDEGASYEIALMISDGYSNGTMTLAEGYNFIWLLVTAEDGETTANYTVTVTRAASSSGDATLSALTLSGLNIGAFNPATTDYTASVANDVTETAVTATANDEGATYVIKLDGAADADGTVELAVGANFITVEVTAEDGQTTNIYTVTVTRAGPALTAEFQEAPESHNGTDAFTFRIAFSEAISTSYVVVRDHALEVTGGTVAAAGRVDGRSDLWWIRVQPDSDADVTIALPADRACDTQGAVCTADGKRLSNRLELAVPGPQPTLSSDATLSGVDIGTFDPATTEYTASVANSVTETTVTPTANDDGATYAIKLDGVADSDGTVPLAEGSNVITVEVTAEDGQTTRTYTVTVTRAEAPPPASSDATLNGLTLSGVDIGTFASATTDYTASVANSVTETTVTPTVNDDGATYAIKLDGVADSDGTVPLAEGSNVITIEVTAEDGQATRTYTVTVTRAAPPSTDATLSALTLSGVNFGTFASATTEYTASVGNDVAETTVAATANDGGATYVVNLDGAEDADGTVTLAVGDNTVAIEVTAEDGSTTRTYTVTVTRAEAPPSDDATLSGLTLSGVNFGAFNSATTEYTASVENGVTETTVTVTANDGGATYVIKVGGAEDADGNVPLAEGSNAITIEVTAEDGNTAKTYTVTVTRAAPTALSASVTVTLSPRSEQHSTGTDITIEWTDSDACGGQYFVGVYDNEELEVVVRVLGYHPAPATTKLSADLGLPWDSISSYDWWVGVICTSEWTLVGKASLQSGLPSDS